MRTAANLGLLVRETSSSFATQLGPQLLHYGAAAAYGVDKKTDVILELSGRSGLNQFASFYNDVNPFEVDLAGRRAVTGIWLVTAGVGRGLGNGVGAPDLRLFAGVGFNPDYRDRDRNDISDILDECPDQPEDRDGFEDDDGCPDPDNDRDGIPDAKDKCPNDPEDIDGFQDEDGCPDPDNDKDGIPDLNDACPNAPEDGKGKFPHDGFRRPPRTATATASPTGRTSARTSPRTETATRTPTAAPIPTTTATASPTTSTTARTPPRTPTVPGRGRLPRSGQRQGRHPQRDRQVPEQAETLNGIKDDDGCPNPGRSGCGSARGGIEVDERIGFVGHGGKLALRADSAQMVNDVALVLKGHPDIVKMRSR